MSAKNLLREAVTDAEYLRELPNGHLARYVCGPHFPNLSITKFSSVMHIPMAWICWASGIAATLSCLVSHIVGMRAKKQMGRITARRIVAAVQALKIPRIFVNEPPYNPMCQKPLSSWATSSDSKLAVSSLWEKASNPFPALIILAFMDSRPEGFEGPFRKIRNKLPVSVDAHSIVV